MVEETLAVDERMLLEETRGMLMTELKLKVGSTLLTEGKEEDEVVATDDTAGCAELGSMVKVIG